jgi:hypothetical protein
MTLLNQEALNDQTRPTKLDENYVIHTFRKVLMHHRSNEHFILCL